MPKIFNTGEKSTTLPEENVLEVEKIKYEPRKKSILLRRMNHESYIWTGIAQKNEFSSEEPVVLDLDDEKFYFYSKGLEKKNYTSDKRWISFNTLDDYKKEELLEMFAKVIDQNDLFQKSVWFKLKVDLLDKGLDMLEEDLKLKDKFSKLKIMEHKAKIVPEYASLYYLINQNRQYLIENDDPVLNVTSSTINVSDSSINPDFSFKNNKEEPKTWEELIKYVARKEKIDEISEEEIIFLQKSLKLTYKRFNALIKLLEKHSTRLNLKKSIALKTTLPPSMHWIWNGTSEKDKFSLEEPVVLDLGGKNFYFYSKEIKRKRFYDKQNWVVYKDLNYSNQLNLLESFAKQNDQKYWYNAVLLAVKAEFLITLSNLLQENLEKKTNVSDEEFMNLTMKFVSEHDSFYALLNKDEQNRSYTNQDLRVEKDSRIVYELRKNIGGVAKKFKNLLKDLEEKGAPIKNMFQKAEANREIEEYIGRYNQTNQYLTNEISIQCNENDQQTFVSTGEIENSFLEDLLDLKQGFSSNLNQKENSREIVVPTVQYDMDSQSYLNNNQELNSFTKEQSLPVGPSTNSFIDNQEKVITSAKDRKEFLANISFNNLMDDNFIEENQHLISFGKRKKFKNNDFDEFELG